MPMPSRYGTKYLCEPPATYWHEQILLRDREINRLRGEVTMLEERLDNKTYDSVIGDDHLESGVILSESIKFLRKKLRRKNDMICEGFEHSRGDQDSRSGEMGDTGLEMARYGDTKALRRVVRMRGNVIKRLGQELQVHKRKETTTSQDDSLRPRGLASDLESFNEIKMDHDLGPEPAADLGQLKLNAASSPRNISPLSDHKSLVGRF